MRLPTAFLKQARFEEAVRRTVQSLAPQVVDVIPTLGDDWSGEPSVFFMVILADAATRRDRLLRVANRVSQTIIDEVKPLEEWGVLPYFNFRSQSEQAELRQPALV